MIENKITLLFFQLHVCLIILLSKHYVSVPNLYEVMDHKLIYFSNADIKYSFFVYFGNVFSRSLIEKLQQSVK